MKFVKCYICLYSAFFRVKEVKKLKKWLIRILLIIFIIGLVLSVIYIIRNIIQDKKQNEIFEELEKDYVTGLTLSGGDPLAKSNRNEILDLMIEVKDKFPNKDIWCYTGYKFDEVKTLKHMKYIDVLVDGKFEKELSTPSPKWRGSSNQKVIYLNKIK